ncbi:MAG: phosphotransferase, partial [Paracoccaceae bacterium]
PGGNPSDTASLDMSLAATDLAGFILALHAKPTANSPASGPQNNHRGVALLQRDTLAMAAIARVADLYNARDLTAAWTSARDASAWQGAPVWLHGDLHPGNLLAVDGRLSAVIDFGLLGAGDPACDLMAGWTFLTAGSREIFKTVLGADDATWARARGWALSVALIALAYYRGGDTAIIPLCHKTIGEVLNDSGQD